MWSAVNKIASTDQTAQNNVPDVSEHNVQIGIREHFYQDLQVKLVSDPIFVSFHFLAELASAARLYKCRRSGKISKFQVAHIIFACLSQPNTKLTVFVCCPSVAV